METQQESVARDFHHGGSGGSGEMLNGKEYLEDNDPESVLRQIKTSGTGSVTISADLFEKMYLQPKLEALPFKHPLQRILGNPTALLVVAVLMRERFRLCYLLMMGWIGGLSDSK